LIGPRQCGKTTFLKNRDDNWKIFDLEKNSDFEIISRDPDLFLRMNPKHNAFDESQLLPSLFPALRVAIDQNRDIKGRFIITGSSSPELVSAISESLAGRVGIIELAPFSFQEISGYRGPSLGMCLRNRDTIETIAQQLHDKGNINLAHDFWFKGGYPEPWLENDTRFTEVWMEQYMQTYIRRDVAALFPGLNQNKYRLFIQLLAGLSGSVINYSEISRALGVSQPTVRDYFAIAHGSFIWRNVSSYEKNCTKRIVKHPRGYLRDSGLLHYLLKIPSKEALLVHPRMGHSWESMVIEEILRNLTIAGVSCDYYYFRTSAGMEIDLLLEGTFGLIPVEIKYAKTVNSREIRSLSTFIDEQKCPFGIVVNNDECIRYYSEKIIGIPFTFL
jgi:hypothetical protein